MNGAKRGLDTSATLNQSRRPPPGRPHPPARYPEEVSRRQHL